MTDIILLGCWNNVDCINIDKPNYRDLVLENIKANEKNIKFILIAGDNWYNNIKDKVKYYFTNILNSGYLKILDINKETHVILGNHDENVDSSTINKDMLELKKDCMIATQLYFLNKDFINEDDLTLEKIKKINKKQNKILLYTGIDIEYVEYPKCIVVFINTNIFDDDIYTDKDLKKNYIIKINDKLEEIKSKSISNKRFFVLGHVPLVSYKIKKGKELNKLDFFEEIYDILVKYNCIYLCADTHNFQISKISKNDKHIIQIVSGTGGADPDIIDNKNQDEFYNVTSMQKEEYEIKYDFYYYKSYGYTKINIKDDNSLSISYNKVEDLNDTSSKIYNFTIDTNNNIIKNTVVDYNKNGLEYDGKEICTKLDDKYIVKNEKKDTYCYMKKEKDKSVSKSKTSPKSPKSPKLIKTH
jgi:hypothetical protein